MKKRIAALALALCLGASLLLVPAQAADAETKLETVKVLGIMNGDGAGNLNLSRDVTRAEFVTMMTSASVHKDTVGSGYGTSLFKDVKSDHWAGEYIRLALEEGWVSGYVDGTFRPDRSITLEEACTALLRLLGYDTGNFSGSYPTAQLNKAAAIGLLDEMTAKQGTVLTRNDCVTLFYNLLTAQDSTGKVYATTLGYTVRNGEVDYSALVTNDTKGPYLAGAGGSVSLPFGTGSVTAYRNGVLADLSATRENDVYYYNEGLRTVWVYSARVTGTLTALSPSAAAPTSVTVAGNSYAIGTSTATYKLSSQGSFAQGSLVTLLLGMNGEVVDVLPIAQTRSTYHGVVVSSAKSATSSATASGASSAVQVVTEIACTDGTVHTFYHTGTVRTVGQLVTATVTADGTTLKSLNSASMSGTVNTDGTKFGGYKLADDIIILDTDAGGGYAYLYPSRLAGAQLATKHVKYYTLNDAGEIDCLILYEATGDSFTYAYMTSAADYATGEGSYSYIANGQVQSPGGGSTYAISKGGVALIRENGALKGFRQLKSVTVDSISELYANADGQSYRMDEGVQVYLCDASGNYFATTLDEVREGGHTLKGWYDDMGCPAGGRIRIIVAT